MTRIALTKGSLRIPPTYFAVQHAMRMARDHEFAFFTAAAQITDPEIAAEVDIRDSSEGTRFGPQNKNWTQRERALPLAFPRMRRAIEEWQPDVIHQHFANWSQPAVAASRRSSVPLVLTVHGADVYVPLTPMSERNLLGRPTLRWHQRTVQRAFDQSTRILAVSEYLARTVVEAGAPPNKVEVHYQGVDTDLYRPTGKERTAPDRVVFVGALSYAKGVLDLAQASISTVGAVPHELVIVGEGPLHRRLDELAVDHPHIDVRGPQDRAGVRAALQGAALFVLPTQRSGRRREAAGLVSLEAQAMGVPTIVYDSGGAAEMLQDGVTGLVVPERDIPALADGIRSILRLSDPEWRAMSMRARDFVVSQRSLQASALQLSEHYADLAGGKA